MQDEQFFDRVRERVGGDPQRARDGAAATLRALAQVLPADEVGDLATQLPHDLTRLVEESARQQVDLGLEAFYVRVAELGGLSGEQAERYAQATLAVLKEAVSTGQFANVARSLPDELSPLLP